MTLIDLMLPEERQFLFELKECLEEPLYIHRSDSLSLKNCVDIVRTTYNQYRIARLCIRDNQISCFPKSLRNLKLITYIQLKNVSLMQFPSIFCDLPHLESLSLVKCDLHEISDKINQLRELYELNLKNNQITNIPIELTNLPNLKNLNLAKNKIKQLPPEFVHLISLETLNLSENLFVQFPWQIGELPHLADLSIESNPFSLESKEIFDKFFDEDGIILLNSLNEMKEFFQKKWKNEKDYRTFNPLKELTREQSKEHEEFLYLLKDAEYFRIEQV